MSCKIFFARFLNPFYLKRKRCCEDGGGTACLVLFKLCSRWMVALKENPWVRVGDGCMPRRRCWLLQRGRQQPPGRQNPCATSRAVTVFMPQSCSGCFPAQTGRHPGQHCGCCVTTEGLLMLLWLAALGCSMQAKEQILWNWLITSSGNLHSSLLLPIKANIQVSLFVLFLQHEVTNLPIWGILPLIGALFLLSPILLGPTSPVNLKVFYCSSGLKAVRRFFYCWTHIYNLHLAIFCSSTPKRHSSRSC